MERWMASIEKVCDFTKQLTFLDYALELSLLCIYIGILVVSFKTAISFFVVILYENDIITYKGQLLLLTEV